MEFVNAKDIIPPIEKVILIREKIFVHADGKIIWGYYLAQIFQPCRFDKKFAKDYFQMEKICYKNQAYCPRYRNDCELDFDYCVLENPA